MTVDQIELVRLLEHLRELHHVRGERIALPGVQPQGARDRGHDGRRAARVPAREESDLVAPADLFLDQIGDDALGAPVESGRHALVERSEVSDSHGQLGVQTDCQRERREQSPAFLGPSGAPRPLVRKTFPVRATDSA